MTFLKDMYLFLKMRKKLWLLPVICALLAAGTIIVLAESSTVGSFMYTLF